MNPRNLLAACVVVLTVAAGSLPAMASTEADGLGPFVDTDGTLFEEPATSLWAAGVTAGCAPWRFCPDHEVTREEMAAFLARALGLPTFGESRFTDTAGSVFSAEIDAIDVAGITHGCGGDRFCPHDAVTRAQMASFLVRILDLPPVGVSPFDDDDGDIHETDIAALAAAGITDGCGPDLYCPDRHVTRAEMAAFLSRALGLAVPADLPVIPADVHAEYLEELATPPWPSGGGAEGWRPLVEVYFRGSDVDRAIRIMGCESHGDPEARNPSSGASGLFQHLPRYWSERSASAGFGGHSIFDPVANVAVAAWMIYEYPGGGWQHWVCQG